MTLAVADEIDVGEGAIIVHHRHRIGRGGPGEMGWQGRGGQDIIRVPDLDGGAKAGSAQGGELRG